jgi:hypothetical protein
MKRAVILSIAFQILATLACASEQQHGLLPLDCSPATFTLRGEVDSVWQGTVQSGQVYEVVVVPVSSDHSMSLLGITVADAQRNPIAYDPEATNDTASLSFVAPESGEILIVVYSETGEDQENLGTFQIKLCEADRQIMD